MGKFWGNFSLVTTLPDYSHWLPFEAGTGLRRVGEYFSQSRFAARVYGGYALPSQAQIFSMGGGELFRGFALSQRQGSGITVLSGEWRLPLIRQCELDVVDRLVGLRNLYGALFCDTGNVWSSGSQVGPWATAVGAGIRADLAFLGFLERGLVRFDVGQAINAGTGVQVWFGLNQPF
jgi:hemolysin activation/secretion protein